MTAALVHETLKKRLDLLAISPTIKTVWPNYDHKPDGKAHLVAEIIPAPNSRLTIKGRNRIAGSLVITVAVPIGGGSGQATAYADAVVAHFPVDLRLPVAGGNFVRITETPTVRAGFRDGAYWRVPVTAPFEYLQ